MPLTWSKVLETLVVAVNVKKPKEEKTAEETAAKEMETETANTATKGEDLDDINVPADDVNDWSNE